MHSHSLSMQRPTTTETSRPSLSGARNADPTRAVYSPRSPTQPSPPDFRAIVEPIERRASSTPAPSAESYHRLNENRRALSEQSCRQRARRPNRQVHAMRARPSDHKSKMMSSVNQQFSRFAVAWRELHVLARSISFQFWNNRRQQLQPAHRHHAARPTRAGYRVAPPIVLDTYAF